jgi:hypothetical protein
VREGPQGRSNAGRCKISSRCVAARAPTIKKLARNVRAKMLKLSKSVLGQVAQRVGVAVCARELPTTTVEAEGRWRPHNFLLGPRSSHLRVKDARGSHSPCPSAARL